MPYQKPLIWPAYTEIEANPLEIFKEDNISNENEIKTLLINILGKDAISTGKMQISDETSKLAKAVNYLVLQLKLLGNINEKDERKSYIETIHSQLIEILK